jgi:DNA polymerase IV (DinB-like DNA polymerase)
MTILDFSEVSDCNKMSSTDINQGFCQPIFELIMTDTRIIAHVDMDAFYAAVEERYNPPFRGVPLVVGADPKQGTGRGVVTTANYLARRFGIHSALPISRAWRLAEAARRRGEPPTIFVPPNFRLYGEVSSRIMRLLEHAADAFEEASIDEAYLDLSSLGTFEAGAERIATVKNDIREQEGLGCSVGIGPNKLVAKIASSYRKPDGLTIVTPERVNDFLGPLPIRAIPGIGPKGEALLHRQSIQTIEELREVSLANLSEWFGKWGSGLYDSARGIDRTPVSNDWIRKSIGEQETFADDTRSPSVVAERLNAMAERLIVKLREKAFSGFRTITLTVRFSDFQTKNRSHSVKNGILVDDSGQALQLLNRSALMLLLPFFDARENPRRKAIRLIGLRLEKLI